MDEIEHSNGHRPAGLLHLLHPALMSAPRPKPEDLSYDLEAVLSAVLPMTTEVPADAYTAPTLGTERQGNGVLIDDQGLILTIGYLILEATGINIVCKGSIVPASIVGYDNQSGFGLVRTVRPLDARPIEIGSSAALQEHESVIIAAQGGLSQAISGRVVSKREFAGSWEYLLDEAIFTSPLHPNWSGAAVIGTDDGKLRGIGSLFIQEVASGQDAVPGNMFVPIDILKPIYCHLLANGAGPGRSQAMARHVHDRSARQAVRHRRLAGRPG